MHRKPSHIGHGAIRVDLHMTHYGDGFDDIDHEARVQRLAELVKRAVEDAIFEHAQEEIGQCYMVQSRSGVHLRIHKGLGPNWNKDDGSDAWVPGRMSAPSHEKDFSLENEEFYQNGARHISGVVDWS